MTRLTGWRRVLYSLLIAVALVGVTAAPALADQWCTDCCEGGSSVGC